MIDKSAVKKVFLIFVGIFGEISSLIFLFFVKYRIHNLNLSDVNPYLTGNLINSIITIFIVLSLVFALFKFKKIKIIDLQIYINLLFATIILLLILALLLSKDFYFLSLLKSNDYEFEKVLSTLIWLIFFVVKVFSMNFMILKILNIKRALVLKNFILISVYFAIIIFIAFVKINFVTRTGEEFLFKKGEKFDAVVVLGAAVWKGNIPSPIYEGRLNKAYELLNKKFASKIFLTGSNAPYELSEAEVGKIYLEKKGVKPEQIELEEKTTSTIEQIHYIKREIMAKRKLNKLIVISDAFHLPRVIEIAKFLSVEFKVARSNIKIEFINNLWLRIREAVLLSIFWLFAV